MSIFCIYPFINLTPFISLAMLQELDIEDIEDQTTSFTLPSNLLVDLIKVAFP